MKNRCGDANGTKENFNNIYIKENMGKAVCNSSTIEKASPTIRQDSPERLHN